VHAQCVSLYGEGLAERTIAQRVRDAAGQAAVAALMRLQDVRAPRSLLAAFCPAAIDASKLADSPSRSELELLYSRNEQPARCTAPRSAVSPPIIDQLRKPRRLCTALLQGSPSFDLVAAMRLRLCRPHGHRTAPYRWIHAAVRHN